MFLVHKLNDGAFEIIDADFLYLYDIKSEHLFELSEADHKEYLEKHNHLTKFIDNKFIYSEIQYDIQQIKQQQIEQMCQKINALRDEKINGGVYVESIDKWIDSDATAERNMLSVKASFDLFGDDAEFDWICADNSAIKLTKEILLQIWQTVMQSKTANHANAVKHKTLVAQAEKPLEYDYSDGWSTTYLEHIAQQNTDTTTLQTIESESAELKNIVINTTAEVAETTEAEATETTEIETAKQIDEQATAEAETSVTETIESEQEQTHDETDTENQTTHSA